MATDKLHMSNQTSAKATLCLAHLAGIRPEETKQYKIARNFFGDVFLWCVREEHDFTKCSNTTKPVTQVWFEAKWMKGGGCSFIPLTQCVFEAQL